MYNYFKEDNLERLMMITIAGPVIEEEEIHAVNNVLHSGMLAQGPKVSELEEKFAEYCGTKYAVAVNSGTAAIHSALHVAGVRMGDEVITTPFSFIATINPILMCGAKPVLVDIEPKTFNIDVNKIEKAITEKTKAIIPVDLYGQPCDWKELRKIAEKHNLILIEDACQAIGSSYDGMKAGSLGDIGCFSLYATKNIMCGEGGVVTTNNEEYANAVKRFRQHGMSGPYEYAGLGYNYRTTDLHAAIAVEQLKKANSFNQIRQKNADLLYEGLKDVRGLILPILADSRTHVYHQFTIRLTDEFPISRETLMDKLRAKDIITGIYYPKPLHSYNHISSLGYKAGDFPVAEQAASEVLSLPVHPKVTVSDVKQIVSSILEVTNG